MITYYVVCSKFTQENEICKDEVLKLFFICAAALVGNLGSDMPHVC